MTTNITLPSTPFQAQVAANLRYFIDLCEQLDDTNLETAETEKQNIWQAIAFGLKFDETADLSAQLMTKLLPLIERKGYAADWIEPVQSATTKVVSPRLTLELTHLLGILHRLVSAFDESIRLHQYVLAQTTIDENRALHILSYQQLCNVYLSEHRYVKAEQSGKQALTLLDKHHAPRVNRAWILNSLAVIAHETGDYETAADWFDQTITVQIEKGNDVLLAINWMNYGRTLSQLKRYDEAIAAYEQSLQLFDGTAAQLDRCYVQLSYGDTLAQMEQYESAETIFRNIDLEYLRQANHHRIYAWVVHNLGSVLLSQQKHQEASLYLDEAHTIAQSIDHATLMGSVSKMKGEIAYHRGDMSEAKDCFEQAKTIFATVDTSWTRQEGIMIADWLKKVEAVESSQDDPT